MGMFAEAEPGKPKSWTSTVAIIVVVMIVNVSVFVVLRVLLDSDDENDEPLLQGKLRDDVTNFLGIFAMTFCFGCFCCFCCGGKCCKWLCSCRCCSADDLSYLFSAVQHKASFRFSKRSNDDEELDDEEMGRKLGANYIYNQQDEPTSHANPAFVIEAADSVSNYDLARVYEDPTHSAHVRRTSLCAPEINHGPFRKRSNTIDIPPTFVVATVEHQR